LFDPIHGTDGDVDAVVASGAVVIGDYDLIYQTNDFSGLLFVYLVVRFRVDPIHANQQLLAVLVSNGSYAFKEVFHAKRILMVGSDEG
jgi:hypothetical protein